MEVIDKEKFEEMRMDAEVLESDGHGDKVLRTPQNQIIKLFRLKRKLSSAVYYPYSQRFADNATKLKALGFQTINVTGVYNVPSIKRNIVVYDMLPGDTLRNVLTQNQNNEGLIKTYCKCLATLHEKGVYFRSVHFGNILIRKNESEAIIDISDMKFYKNTLNVLHRVRNFKAALRYKVDRESLKEFGFEKFLTLYAEYANFSKSTNSMFVKALKLYPNHPASQLFS